MTKITELKTFEGGSRSDQTIRLCALLTCFNRRDKTLACLRALESSADRNVELAAVLVDDGSTDGTVEAVRSAFPWVMIEHGGGALFWARGMHRAFEIALESGYDYYLWLNDDTTLDGDAVRRLLDCEKRLRLQSGAPAIVVGSTVDAGNGRLTYGGGRRVSRWRPMRFARLDIADAPQKCDVMNGNIVLISADAARAVGNIDPVFEHAMGDTDYALRANRLGVAVWAAAGTHGTCSGNPVTGTFMDRAQPFSQRWRQMLSRKGLPWRSWLAITSKHAGVLWPIHFVWPYLRLALDGLRGAGGAHVAGGGDRRG